MSFKTGVGFRSHWLKRHHSIHTIACQKLYPCDRKNQLFIANFRSWDRSRQVSAVAKIRCPCCKQLTARYPSALALSFGSQGFSGLIWRTTALFLIFNDFACHSVANLSIRRSLQRIAYLRLALQLIMIRQRKKDLTLPSMNFMTAEKISSKGASSQAKDRYNRPQSSSVNAKQPVTAMQIKEMQNINLRLSSLSPMKFEGETTNQREFLPFKVKQRPQTAKPKIDVVVTNVDPSHFDTNNKRQFKGHENWRPPMVDFIPYP